MDFLFCYLDDILIVKETNFLDHQINHDGVTPLPQKVAAVMEFPQPKTAQSLREFIGMVNFYHRFIPQVADKLHPIYTAILPQKRDLVWTGQFTGAMMLHNRLSINNGKAKQYRII